VVVGPLVCVCCRILTGRLEMGISRSKRTGDGANDEWFDLEETSPKAEWLPLMLEGSLNWGSAS
jgi:hypothetical protein